MHSRWREAAAVPTEGRTQRTARQLCCPNVPLSCFPRPYPSRPSHRKPRYTRRAQGGKGPPLPVLGFLGRRISMGPLRSHWSKWSQRHAQLRGRLGRSEIKFSPVSTAKALGDTSRVQQGSVGGTLSMSLWEMALGTISGTHSRTAGTSVPLGPDSTVTTV